MFASLSGKTAVVTGASSGIGRAIARELALAGGRILIHYAQSQDQAEALAAEIRGSGGEAETVAADFSALHESPEVCEDLIERLWERVGPLDIWVNNAGVDLLTGEGKGWDYATKLQKLLSVDVTAGVLLSRAVGERMRLRGTGVILNIGWDQADRGMGGESAELFSTAKNAIMGFTRSLAVSLAPEVRVNCIAPGWIRTAWGEQASAEWQARVLRETPLKRWGEPEDIARLARFLVSDEASYVTGQVINANGGAIR